MEGGNQPPIMGYARPGYDVDVQSLLLLRNAYYKAYWLILTSLVTSFMYGFVEGVIAAGTHMPAPEFRGANLVGLVATVSFVNFWVAFWLARMIATARGKGVGYQLWLSIGAAIPGPCCFGCVCAAVIQQAAANELKRRGIRSGFMGINKVDLEARIAQAARAQSMPPPPNMP